jgi:hypothetical protein
MQKEKGHNGSHKDITTKSKNIEEIFMCMPHLWYEWTQNDTLWWMLMLQQEVRQLKKKCSKINNQGK